MNVAPLIDATVFADLQAAAGHEFIAELVGTFAEEAPQLLVELRSAFTSGAAERFRRAAHSLKSNSNTFGATRLAELARTLEMNAMPASAAPLDELALEFDSSVAALRALASENQHG